MESWSTCTSNCLNESYGIHDQGLPPGFRFHPTDEELVTHYLSKKIENPSFICRAVTEVDLNKSEPWELPEKAQMGEKECYFYSARDRKYPTGMRTNRATEAGYWKATGKDREVFSGGDVGRVVGMKKTLVFYRGRAPKGIKTNWVMHEYRNINDNKSSRSSSSHSKDEWVVCRIFHKTPGGKKMSLSELRQGSHVTSNGEGLYATTLPALLDSPVPLGSVSGGGSSGRSIDQESLMFNALIHYNNNAIKSEPTICGSGVVFGDSSMTSIAQRSSITTPIFQPYGSTSSSPSLVSSISNSHVNHPIVIHDGANIMVPMQRSNHTHSSQGVSSPNTMMSNNFNTRNSPHNINTSNDQNYQQHLSCMHYMNPAPYIDPLVNITPSSLAPLSRLPSDLDTFWLYSDRL